MYKIAYWYRNLNLKSRVILSINAAIVIAFIFITIIATNNRIRAQEELAKELAINEISQTIRILQMFPDYNIDDFRQMVETYSIFNTGFMSIVSSTGEVLLCRFRENRNISGIEYFDQMQTKKKGLSIYPDPVTNRIKYHFFEFIPQLELFVVITLDKDEIITKPVRNTQMILIFALIISLAMFTLVNFLIMQTITNPLQTLKLLIEKLSKGELPDQYKYKYKDDIGQMVKSVNNLVGGLKQTALFAESIGHNKFDYNFQTLGENDVLGNALLELRQSLKTADENQKLREIDDQKRAWSAQGLAKFAEILRNNNDNLNELSYDIIKNLVSYLGINQGGIFLLNENLESGEKGHLEMTASYAYDRRKFLQHNVMIGEGLIGTCFLEKETIYLTKIPDQYIKITSGLGDKNPSSLLIVPLKLNGIVYGILELASFGRFEQYQIEFTEKIGESIASTISSVKTNLQTSMLLQKSQQQAIEMRSAEEEMKQNMEELTSTQEAMADNDRRNMQLIEKLTNEKNNIDNNLLRLKDEISTTLDKCPIAVIQYDHKKAVLLFNEVAENLWGYEQGAVYGMEFKRLFTESFHSELEKIVADGSFMDLKIKTRSGAIQNVKVYWIESGSGEWYKVTGFVIPANGHLKKYSPTDKTSVNQPETLQKRESVSLSVTETQTLVSSESDEDLSFENLLKAKDAETQNAWSQHLDKKGKHFKKGKKH